MKEILEERARWLLRTSYAFWATIPAWVVFACAIQTAHPTAFPWRLGWIVVFVVLFVYSARESRRIGKHFQRSAREFAGEFYDLEKEKSSTKKIRAIAIGMVAAIFCLSVVAVLSLVQELQMRKIQPRVDALRALVQKESEALTVQIERTNRICKKQAGGQSKP